MTTEGTEPTQRTSMELGTLNIAYLLSTRKLAEEPLYPRQETTSGHRGNLLYISNMIEQHNQACSDAGGELVELPRMELKVIVHHDAEQLRRFEDIPAPVRCISAAELFRIRDAKNGLRAAREAAKRKHGPDSQEFSRASSVYRYYSAHYAEAREEYDRQIVGMLHEYDIDVALLDRWRVIMGPEFLRSYLGAAINTC